MANSEQVYEKISQHVRAAHCWLDNPKTASDDIDVYMSFA